MEHGIIINGIYITSIGEPIKFGEPIELHFAGAPHDMPRPWTLENGTMQEGADLKQHPSITCRAANGVLRTFNNAEIYSPKGSKGDDYFQRFLHNPCNAVADTMHELGI